MQYKDRPRNEPSSVKAWAILIGVLGLFSGLVGVCWVLASGASQNEQDFLDEATSLTSIRTDDRDALIKDAQRMCGIDVGDPQPPLDEPLDPYVPAYDPSPTYDATVSGYERDLAEFRRLAKKYICPDE